MPPPLSALASIASIPDAELGVQDDFVAGRKAPAQFVLYDVLRHEQALAAGAQEGRSEAARVLDLAQQAYGDIVGLLIGRDDAVLETARDGDWSLRDILRHATAVELRYGAQVEYAAGRLDEEPLAIPDERLPCDRLSPPEPGFGESRTAGLVRMLELVGRAREITDTRLGGVDDRALDRPSLWGKVEIPVRMRMHQIAAHLVEVAIQADKCLGPRLDSEARRILRHCAATRGSHERWSPAADRAALDERYRSIARDTTAAS